MNENTKAIEKIANQETKISNLKWYIGASFFPASVAVIWIYIKALMELAVDPSLAIEHERVIAVRILTAFMLYMVAIIAGYIYNRVLTKKLDRLWEKKKTILRKMHN